MSNPKSDRPLDKNPPDRSFPQRKDTNIRSEQNTEEDQGNQNRQQRSYTGNSERTGQQYSSSVEGNSSQRADELNKPQRSHRKNQLDQSHGSELSQKERSQQARGMNSPGMKNDQEMHRSVEKRNLAENQDRKADLKDGEC